MKQNLVIKLFFLFFLFHVGNLQSQKLSKISEISLLTCNPGDELYSIFGHNAIRVQDRANGIDWVYNYGTFDFNTPNFYVKFVHGKLNYMLSVNQFRQFMYAYQYENRSVYEQVLNLSQEQKQKIFSFLQNNRLPQNKYYLYDFFFDNCATRLRDVLEINIGNNLKFTKENIDTLTFRDMLMSYLKNSDWSRFGINLILGSVIDRKASQRERMFLPDYLKDEIANATIDIDGQKMPIVKYTRPLFIQTRVAAKTIFWFSPDFLFWLLFALTLLMFSFEIKKGKQFYLFDEIFFFILGVSGLILLLVWVATDHTAVVKNWNLIWALPTHLVAALWMIFNKKSLILRYYFLINGMLAILIFPFCLLIPQHFDFASVPLILISSIRSFYFYYHNK